MDVFAVALTASEKRLVGKAVAAFEPENGPDQQRRQNVLELLRGAPPVASTDNYTTTEQTGGTS